jgi:FtsH-binding integral membrane protein
MRIVRDFRGSVRRNVDWKSVMRHHQAVTEESARPPAASHAESDHLDRDHLRKEAWTMGLYVTVCLLAALTALESAVAVPGRVFGLVWGTTVGLALAHLFAFRIAGRLVHDGRLPRSDQIVSGVQLAAAAAIALLVSIPILIASPTSELDWARYTCAGIIGVAGYGVARSADRSRTRSVIFGLAVLAVAIIIAAVKHQLAGH